MQTAYVDRLEEVGWCAAAHTACLARLYAELSPQIPELCALERALDALSAARGELRRALEKLAGAERQSVRRTSERLREAAFALAEPAVLMLDASEAARAGKRGSFAALRALTLDYERLWSESRAQLRALGVATG